jgi:TRAP-type transport system periplasmic protein
MKSKFILICSLLALLNSGSLVHAGDTYTMKMATLSPEDTTWADYAYKVRDEVQRLSGGRLKMIWYFGGVMGDEGDMVKKVRIGQLQGGVFTLLGLGMMVPAIKIFGLPMLFQSQEELDYVLAKIEPTFREMFSAKKYLLTGFAEVGFVYLFSKAPLQSMRDISGVKMWSWKGDAVAESALRRIGVNNVVPLNVQEVMTSLQTGMIDSFYATNYTSVALQWNSYIKYVTDWHFAYTPGGVVLDNRFFKKLPPDLQKIFVDAWHKYLPELAVAIHADEKRAQQAMQGNGITVTDASAELMVELRDKSKKVYTEFAGKYYSQALLDQVLTYLAEFRKKASN